MAQKLLIDNDKRILSVARQGSTFSAAVLARYPNAATISGVADSIAATPGWFWDAPNDAVISFPPATTEAKIHAAALKRLAAQHYITHRDLLGRASGDWEFRAEKQRVGSSSQKSTARGVSESAVLATRIWLLMAKAATDFMVDKPRVAFTTKVAIVEAFGNLPVRKWYGIILADQTKRQAWSGFSVDGSGTSPPIYVDFLAANGAIRTPDGDNTIILSGASMPTNFDPEA